jgi:Flp pilus assembly CpaF family ATPase
MASRGLCAQAIRGQALAIYSLKSESSLRGARMLRTALGPAIAGWLADPKTVEVMLNPDGRLWLDRLSDAKFDA